jgi:hypothetical protein
LRHEIKPRTLQQYLVVVNSLGGLTIPVRISGILQLSPLQVSAAGFFLSAHDI